MSDTSSTPHSTASLGVDDDVPAVVPARHSGSIASARNALLSDEGAVVDHASGSASAAGGTDPALVKQTLHRYLQKHRAALLGKLEGLGERQARWPMTPTGTNVLGLVKHVATMQIGYFGEVFDRPFPDPPAWLAADADPDADMWATVDESIEDVIAFHHASAAHADATIEALDLNTPGSVPWWSEGHRAVTLHRILVHMAYETARHAGHADIVREMLDGLAGDGDGNLADRTGEEWAAWREHLMEVAEQAGLRAGNVPHTA